MKTDEDYIIVPFDAWDNLVQKELELETLKNELAEYQRIYGSLDQSDYLRRTL